MQDIRRPSPWRLVLLFFLLLGLFVLGRRSGIASLSPEKLRTLCAAAGPAGAALFLGAFAIGEMLHVPGMLFVAAAVLGYGRIAGFVLGYLGALLAISFAFVVIRAIGGQALAQIKGPRLQRILRRLDERPVRVVALLRLFLFLAPPLNTVLALSRVRYRDYLLGSALGLLLPVLAVAVFSDWVARLFFS